MSFFADFVIIDRPKAQTTNKPKTLAEFMAHHISDQRRILNGEEVETSSSTSTNKKLKKSWWKESKGYIDARIGVTPLLDGKVIQCPDKATFERFLDQLSDFENNKALKERLETLHKSLTAPKPKDKKAKAAE